ncbi:MAG TPA: winged helix-turn-helix domain-containing tetratricopeptide repeat protein [Steroidobacteraceae bacterium]|nr:winged helix-turn-helix domain-containing tetratricopeptide repeat protein [Steroidobacteraceae bacterium]
MQASLSFDPFRFEPTTGRLWRGSQEVNLTPKAAAVLGALLDRPGELVGKQELFASVWQDTIVSDDALVACVQELRRALADDSRQPRFIETRHRRGYRFLPPVRQVVQAVDCSSRPMVAVLPFENASADPEQEYFSDAITQDIITALSKHRSLLVVARSPSFAFRGRSADVRTVGADLRSDYVVEGSVGRAGTRVRIRARLVETESGAYVWAEQYDRELDAIFDVQDEIVATIAARIEPEVCSAERQRATRKSQSALRAWDCFHLGMKHFYQSTAADNLEAQQFFRRAIELDEELAQAYAWLSYAEVLEMVYFDAEPSAERLDNAIATARKAIELDERDAMTHFACGRALLASKGYQDAIAELESAVELNPNLAVVYCGLGDSLAYDGRFREAMPCFERAIQLSPHDPQRWACYAYRALAHLLAGEFESAVEWGTKATRVPNCHYWPFAHRVAALGYLQRPAESTAAVGELMRRKPGFSCAFARERLFYIKESAHIERYLEGLRRAGIPD